MKEMDRVGVEPTTSAHFFLNYDLYLKGYQLQIEETGFKSHPLLFREGTDDKSVVLRLI
jgi:hypothetical protein